MDSNSGIIFPQEAKVSEHFSDISPMPCKGFNTLCKAKRYGRWWLLKGLKAEHQHQETYRHLLRKEFDILVSLQHPNIVSASSIEDIPGLGYCIVMEWIDGRTLRDFINEHPQSDDKDADFSKSLHGIVLQLFDAMEYIHAKQIVHRDLKPSNIMITYNGNHVKLIDFGLSDTDSYAILKQPAGTRNYVSPEQTCSRKADIRNDIYSLGCVLEDMRLGKRYAPIVARCKAPMAERFANVGEVRRAFLAAERKSHSKAIALTACVLIVVFAVSGYTLLQGKWSTTLPPNHEAVSAARHAETNVANNNKEATIEQDNIKSVTEQKAFGNKVADSNLSEHEKLVILAEGKKYVDSMWQEAGISRLTSITDKSEAFNSFVEQSNDFITTTFPDEYCAAASKEIRTALVYQLSEYTAKKYVKPTLKELQQ